jgi:hypothetical protein
VENGVGIQIVQLNSAGEKEAAEEVMQGERKPAEDKGKEHYPKSSRRGLGNFWPRHTNFRHIILYQAILGIFS